MKTSRTRGASRNGDSGSANHLLPPVPFRAQCTPIGGIARKRALAVAIAMLAVSGCMQMPARQDNPTGAEAKVDYLNDRNSQVNALLDQADQFRLSYQFDAAIQKLYAASQIDPTSERGRKIGALIDQDRRDLTTLQEADRMMQRGSLAPASDRVHRVLLRNPTNALALQMKKEIDDKIRQQRADREEGLAASSIMRTPITLQFRDANVRMVFEALSRTSGLNVIFDRDVRADLKTTIFVTNASLQDTVDMILMQNQLDKKQLNANTLFIYPATPAKQLEYQELKVRTFQLSNVEAKQVQSLLKSLLKIKEVVIDERANTVTIRGTPDTIKVAEEMIAAQDLPEPEVMLEVEVLEVSHERLSNLGIEWPNSFTMSTPSTVDTWGALHHLPINALNVSGLSATANFKLTDTDANLLASPRIRTRNKEKARILIGDKLPVISSSSTPSTSGPSYTQMIQYIDVGIKLEVEPQVYRDGDVGIKLNLEVSNITNTIQSGNSQTGLSSLAYQIGTRSASTSLRLRDGESQILGGLISDQDRRSADKVPGLGQLPILGRLFSDHNGDHVKTEIVLQITPHIVRPQLAADVDTQEVWSGTDVNVHADQLRLDPVMAAAAVPGAPAVKALPGSVGGGTVGGKSAQAGAAANGSTTAPATGSFGQLPPPQRTTPPPAPYGGRFAPQSTAPAPVPVPNAPPAAEQAGGEAETGAGANAAPAATQPPAPSPPAPAPAPTPAPSILQMPPGDMGNDNPLRSIQNGY
ncbi:Type 3 secretion system secretin [Paraburkholderia nemoris]|uniref:secretin N-terminal domain-containing protein n=2 Tax=Paraburkholderia nemoris TaxID=2793076 RepID=UPI00190C758D|nr:MULTISPECIES: type IV pilus secretin PilQ [Paraburkholderia]MBK3784014.1 type IV pilus secretin PilQ [Paraburkholderia aspalathi]CAE6804704.1 Type 3 secretion system secretin [Paraburkholderia nemoris]